MLKHLFKKVPPSTVVDEQLHEAKIKALEHEAAAEYYSALAAMYRARIERLEHQQGTGKTVGTTHSS